MTLFGNRLLADDQVKRRLLDGPSSNTTGVLIKKGNWNTQTPTQGRRHHVKMKAETGVDESASQGMPE